MRIKEHRIFFKISLVLFFIILAQILINFEKRSDNIEYCRKKLQKAIFKKIENSEEFLEKVVTFYNKNSDNSKLLTFVNKNGTDNTLFIYENDSLIFWSNNSVNPVNIKNSFPGFFKFSNGWYLANNKVSGKNNFVYVQLIKKEYNYQNEYLENQFQSEIKVPSNIVLSIDKGTQNIYDNKNNFLFSVQFEKSKPYNELSVFLIFLIYLIAFIIFISFLYDIYLRLKIFDKNKIVLFIVFSLDILILRWLIYYFQIPDFLYQSKLFSPFYYASSGILPSLGDLTVNICIVFILSLIFYRTETKTSGTKGKLSLIIVFLMTLVVFTLLIGYSQLFRSLIIDSGISLTINNPLSLNYLSIIVLIILAVINISLVLLISKIIEIIFNYSERKTVVLIAILSFLASLFFYRKILFSEGLAFVSFTIIFSITAFITESYKNKIKKIYYYGIYLLIFSVFASLGFNQFNQQKEKDKRKLLMQKLAVENDPMSEYLYSDIYKKIKNDTTLSNLIKSFAPENEIINHLKYKYFKGYWSKYNTQITVCKDFQNLFIKPDFGYYNCDKFFYDKITAHGMPTMTENLFLLNDNVYEKNYISLIRLFEHSPDSMLRTSIYIELNAKFIIKDLGYPELLIDKKANTLQDISSYSYARYHNGLLYKNFGKSKYYNTIDFKNYKEKTYYFIDQDGYNHLIYRPNEKSLLILSQKNQSFFGFILPFSYLFSFFAIFLLLFLFFFGNLSKTKFTKSSFKLRLQLSIITILLISFLLVGVSTLIYISSLNNEKHKELLTEKAHSVLVELETLIGGVKEINLSQNESIYDMLVNLSNIFFTDINLYDTNGNLIASSRSQIFEENLISEKINPIAYYELYKKEKNIYINKEKIGKYEYLSAYIPFKNIDNKLVAFLNLPYFAKHNEIKREIASFLTTYLNIYIFLTSIALLIAIFISNYITRPLRLIQEKMSQLKLGKSNEKIEWFRNDEIGKLIKDYNSMIDQIALSAEMLAKSEREQAWREMAKQVAHEIKNPLTPMKLSIQHLQKAWNDKVDDWDKRLNKFSKTLIEQIDSLSEIASEFSDFAKMSSTNFSILNLSEILQSTVNLFITSVDNNIEIETKIEDNCLIYADKKQMIQVFNNLIKNAIQAVQSDEKGLIIIELTKDNTSVTLKIKDNGRGIDNEMKEKIFSPNFTTKSSGMGLGLAIVKSIIETNKGEIWFVSEEGKGTEFYIKFTKA